MYVLSTRLSPGSSSSCVRYMWTTTERRWSSNQIRQPSQIHITSGQHYQMRNGWRSRCSSRILFWLTMARKTSKLVDETKLNQISEWKIFFHISYSGWVWHKKQVSWPMIPVALNTLFMYVYYVCIFRKLSNLAETIQNPSQKSYFSDFLLKFLANISGLPNVNEWPYSIW